MFWSAEKQMLWSTGNEQLFWSAEAQMLRSTEEQKFWSAEEQTKIRFGQLRN